MKLGVVSKIALFITSMSLCPLLPAPARAQDPATFFRQHCAACHTIGGGRLVGPDLKGVTKRKDRTWLVKFLQDPSAMIASGDPYATELKQQAHGIVMPTIPGMTPELANALLDLIEAGGPSAHGSALPAARSQRPFTSQDITFGTELFLGERRLANGGPPCVSCHSLGAMGGLGGGRLGPDLTNAFDRLGGRRGLGTWLSSPPTTTMQSIFGAHALKPDEIHALLAVINAAGTRSRPPGRSSIFIFLAWGLGGMLVSLVVLQIAWRGRLRSVRRSIIHTHVRGGQ